MGKDYLDNIEEFNMDDLPDVNLKEEEVVRIKANILDILDNLRDKYKNLEFKVTLEEAFKIRQRLGENPEKKIFGLKSAKIVRALLFKEIKKKYGFTEKDILYEYDTRVRGESVWSWEGTICYKFIITKDRLLAISLDANANIIKEKYVKFNEIEGAGPLTNKEDDPMIGKTNGAIDLKDGTRFYIQYGYYETDEEFFGFIEKLRSVGVKEIKSSATRNNNLIIAMWVVGFLVLFFFLIL